MNTYKETILQAVERVITQAGFAKNVFRGRLVPLAYEQDEFPAVVILRGSESIDSLNQNLSIRRFDVKIECHARGVPSDAEADKIAAQVNKALLADQTLGGLVQRIFEKESLEPEFPDGDSIQCAIPVIYTFVYATTSQDATRLTS